MTPRKLLLGFFVRLVLLYTILIAIWPVLKGGYCSFYRGMGQLCFARLGSHGTAMFEDMPGDDPVRDTLVVTVNTSYPDARIEKRMPVSARYTGYFPTAVVISLVLATPLCAVRRLRSLAIALVLVNLFILAWLGVSILDDMSEPLPEVPVHGFILAPWLKGTIHFLVENVVESVVACSYVVPVFIWIVVVFGRKDRDRLLAPFVGEWPVAPQPAPTTRGDGAPAP